MTTYINSILYSSDFEKDDFAGLFAEIDMEGLEEKENEIELYLNEQQAEAGEEQIAVICTTHNTHFTKNKMENKNWNEQWESNFQPIKIDDFVFVRATFHPENNTVKHEIIIEPKMSFGTGHHPTTELMIREMKNIDLKGKEILDFGSGTGILSIYASMLGAKHIDAIDNEEWAFENCIENCSLNNIQNVDPILGDSDYPFISTFAIILANVNRHVILQNLAKWHTLLDAKGVLLLSGLLDADEQDVLNKAVGFKHNFTKHLNGWILISLTKSN
mgnify:CR=1 FL=1